MDTYMKKFMSNNAVFANAFYLYNGEQVINPENLKPMDTTAWEIPFKNEKKSPVQKVRAF